MDRTGDTSRLVSWVVLICHFKGMPVGTISQRISSKYLPPPKIAHVAADKEARQQVVSKRKKTLLP